MSKDITRLKTVSDCHKCFYKMQALVFNEQTSQLSLQHDYPRPAPGPQDALIRVLRAGICSTDIEISRGYVPGFNNVLGHEFVGIVEQCTSQPDLVGKRVVGEINCNTGNFTCADAIYTRNHAPGRVVLGIIAKDGCMADYCTLPARNLHQVPDSLSDLEACYAEPVAAACRILEQKALAPGSKVAVLGDGKLGLLIAAVLVADGSSRITLIGRHEHKMKLVAGCTAYLTADEAAKQSHLESSYDAVVEASGSSAGINLALKLLRPMGTLVLKSTVSVKDPNMPGWSAIANDIVVNEKVLVGSRCGPMDIALKMIEKHSGLREMLHAMTHEQHMKNAEAAWQLAKTKGTLKVQLICSVE